MRTLLLALASLMFVGAAGAQTAVRSDMLVTPEWLAAHLHDANLVVLHITRDESTFAAGHIPGARLVTFADIATERPHAHAELRSPEELQSLFRRLGISNSSRVIVYGPPTTATRAYFTLDYVGMGDRAAVLDGGFDRWQREHREIATGAASAVTAGNFVAHPRPEIVATIDQVRQSVDGGNSLRIVDARPPSRYADGHLPGAVNVFWVGTTVSGKLDTSNYSFTGDASLKVPAELRKEFEQLVGAPTKKLVTYCEIGMQASHLYFTAKYLGYDVAMYDGSFEEWSSTQGAPIVKGDRPMAGK